MKRHALFVATALVLSFAAMDRNGDGRIDRSERANGKGWHGGRRGGGIARLDTDGDCRISRAELEQAELEQAQAARAPRGSARGTSREGSGGGGGGRDMLADFAAIDSDRDGDLVRTRSARGTHASARSARPNRRGASRRGSSLPTSTATAA